MKSLNNGTLHEAGWPSQKTHLRVFFDSLFSVHLWLNDIHTTAVSEGTNRNLPAGNTLVQLLALYADPESHNAHRHRQTDRRTDDLMMPIADHTV